MSRHIGGSILPSSSAMILRPIEISTGTFQVRAHEDLDTHMLHFEFKANGYKRVLATHDNGYSCHALAKRLIDLHENKDPTKTEYLKNQVDLQRQYIIDCAGLAQGLNFILDVLEER